jgi:SH3 domain protein
MRIAAIFFALFAITPAVTMAETAYITDKLYVGLREGQGNEYPVMKSIVTGTAVEVLQRGNGFTLVRETGGAEGWIADRYLVDAAPVKASPDVSSAQLAKIQADLDQARKQLALSQQSAREQTKRAGTLEQKLKSLEQAKAAETEAAEATAATDAMSEPDIPAQSDGVVAAGFHFHWLWFLIAFAMLVTGFVSGIFWLREVNRKKMGGMYLRI